MVLEELLRAADESVDELVELHCALVRWPTVNTGLMPTGHEAPCAADLARRLAAEGLPAEVVEPAPGRGNLLARRPGRGGRSLLWMSHLDVVPPGDEQRWSSPPFEPRVVDGWVVGRGSNDCKGLAAPMVHALRLLARLDVPLAGEVRLVCGADEEAGGRWGFGALATSHPEFLRADLALNEGGGSPVELPGGQPGWFVANGEKGRLEAQLTLLGRSDHASVPWLADNPLTALGEALDALADYRPQVTLTPEAEVLLRHVWGVEPPPAAELDAWLAAQPAPRVADVTRLLALTRLTIVPTVARAGAKSNAIPDTATLTCDVRTLPHQTPSDVSRELRRLFGDVRGCQWTLDETATANATPWSAQWEEVLGAALADIGEPGAVLLPTLCTGFTDARLVRPLGTPVLGFAPLPRDTDLDRCGCHNLDEEFPVAGLLFRVKFLLALAWRWCGGEGVSAR